MDQEARILVGELVAALRYFKKNQPMVSLKTLSPGEFHLIAAANELFIRRKLDAEKREETEKWIQEKICTGMDECVQVNLKELTKRFHVSAPAVSRMAHGLEKKGYVRLVPSSIDKRNILFEVTEAGKEVFKKEGERINEICGTAFEKMGKENVEELIHLIKLLGGYLNETIETDQRGQEECPWTGIKRK